MLAACHPDDDVRLDALDALGRHPLGKTIATWLLTLPAYAYGGDGDDDPDTDTTH